MHKVSVSHFEFFSGFSVKINNPITSQRKEGVFFFIQMGSCFQIGLWLCKNNDTMSIIQGHKTLLLVQFSPNPKQWLCFARFF